MARSLFILLLLFATLGVNAQSVITRTELTLNDGSRLIGTVQSENETELVFETLSGLEMRIPISTIQSRKAVRGRLVNGELIPFDPNGSRLFFSATGRPVPKGSSYLAFHEIFLASVGVGVSNRFTMSGAISLLPGTGSQLYFVAPKFALWDKDDRSVSAGVLLGGVLGEPDTGGIIYGTATIGPEDRALSIGTGFLFGGGKVEDSPVVMIGGEAQAGPRVKLITENYFMPGLTSEALLSGGIRMVGHRLTADIALVTSTALISEGVAFPFIPWISFATQLSD